MRSTLTWISWEPFELRVNRPWFSLLALDSGESWLAVISAFASFAQNARNSLFTGKTVSAAETEAARETFLAAEAGEAGETLKWWVEK